MIAPGFGLPSTPGLPPRPGLLPRSARNLAETGGAS